jgi:hypothetical protein
MAVFWTLIALLMEATSTYETMVSFYQITRRYDPEDSHLHLFVDTPSPGHTAASL